MTFKTLRDRQQTLLLPPALDDYVGPDHEVRSIDEFVRSFDLEEKGFTRTGTLESGAGQPQYPAEPLLALYLYGYMHHIRSSRKLAELTQENMRVRWLVRDVEISHVTINNFRRENGNALQRLLQECIQFMLEADLIDGMVVALDGTKIKAQAGRSVLTRKQLETIEGAAHQEAADYLAVLETTENDEPPPPRLAKAIAQFGGIEGVKEYIARKEQEAADAHRLQEESGDAQYIAPNDPEARLMLTRNGKMPAYNVQVGVDGKHNLIVHQEVTQDANDTYQLERQVNAMRATLPTLGAVTVDAGYISYDAIVRYERAHYDDPRQPDVYVALPALNMREPEGFVYDAERDLYRCPQQREMPCVQRNKIKGSSHVRVYRSISCEGCAVKSACTSAERRMIHRHIDHAMLVAHREKIQTQKGWMFRRRRKGMSEHVNGNLKRILGGNFLTKGLKSVAVEMSLAAAAYNLKRILKILPGEMLRKILQKRCDRRLAIQT